MTAQRPAAPDPICDDSECPRAGQPCPYPNAGCPANDPEAFPAAPETDVSVRLSHVESEALADAFVSAQRAEFMDTDFDVPILRAVERIVAERLRVVEGERDRARLSRDAAKNATVRQIRARKSAEADRDALRAGIEALADDFDTTVGFRGAATSLRALLPGDGR